MNPLRLNKVKPKAGLSKAVCVDLDGTICHYTTWKGEESFGDPMDGALEFLRAIRTRGLRIIILTARAWPFGPDGEPRDAEANRERVRAWLRLHKLPFDEVHGKPVAAAYLDDRAVVCRKNPPPGEYARALAEIEQLVGTES